MRTHRGAWVGWTGRRGRGPAAVRRRRTCTSSPCRCRRREIAEYYEGLSQRHAVAALPRRHRDAPATTGTGGTPTSTSTAASPTSPPTRPRTGATVWVQDYQLQLVPRLLRDVAARPADRLLQPHPVPAATSCSPSCPGGAQVLDGLLGADLVGFQRPADANNFLRACRRAGLATRAGDGARAGPRRRAAGAGPGLPDLRRRRQHRRDRPPAGGRRAGPADPRRARATPSWCCSGWTGSTTPRASCTGCRRRGAATPTSG